jgi:hypothetical protein
MVPAPGPRSGRDDHHDEDHAELENGLYASEPGISHPQALRDVRSGGQCDRGQNRHCECHLRRQTLEDIRPVLWRHAAQDRAEYEPHEDIDPRPQRPAHDVHEIDRRLRFQADGH